MTKNSKTKVGLAGKFKKTILIKVCVFVVLFAFLLAVLFAFLLHKPGYYSPPVVISDCQVSPYLSNILAPQFYNSVQRQEPFDLILTEEAINDIIVRGEWPKKTDGITFSAPQVYFVSNKIILTGAIGIKGIELVVTMVGESKIDEQGFLNLPIEKVKVGALSVTALAKAITSEIYRRHLADSDAETETIENRIIATLLGNVGFEPIWEIDNRKVRINHIDSKPEKLTISFVPCPKR